MQHRKGEEHKYSLAQPLVKLINALKVLTDDDQVTRRKYTLLKNLGFSRLPCSVIIQRRPRNRNQLIQHIRKE